MNDIKSKQLIDLVKKIEDPHGNILKEFSPVLIHTAKVSERTLAEVKQGLWEVVNKPGGTAYYRSRIPGIDVIGKTGTAQVISTKEEDRSKKCEELDYQFRDHALFAAVAPLNNPEIAVAVIVEHGCHGSYSAAPVAKSILETFFYKKQILKERKEPHLENNNKQPEL